MFILHVVYMISLSSISNAALVPPSYAQTTNVSFQSFAKNGFAIIFRQTFHAQTVATLLFLMTFNLLIRQPL